MAWSGSRNNPLIFYPAVGENLPDFGFASGAFGAGANQWTAAGATSPTITSGVGETYGYAAKFNPAAVATCYLQRNTVGASTYMPVGTTGTMYWYIRAKVVSAGTNTPFLARLDYYNSSSVYLSSATLCTMFTAGTTGPADSTWYLYRQSFTVTVPANTAKFGCVLGYFGAGPHTNETYVDWVACSFVLDGQDLSGLSNVGAKAVHPFRYGSTAAGTFGKSVAGAYSARRFHSGYRSGTLQMTPFSASNRTTWNSFLTYTTDGTPFSVMYDQSDLSRDFIPKAVLNMDGDGLEQVAATPNWRGSIDWKETP